MSASSRLLSQLIAIALVAVLPLLCSAALIHPSKSASPSWTQSTSTLDPSTPFAFSLTAHMPDPAYLATFLADRSDPTSPHWLQWHTYESLQPHITPVPSAVSAIEAWLASAAGVAWQAYGPFYRVDTTVATAERLLNTTLATYLHTPTSSIRIRRAATAATYLPDSVAAVIVSVHEVDNHDVMVPRHHSVTPSASTVKPPSRHRFHPTLYDNAYLTGSDIGAYYDYPNPLLQPAPATAASWPTSVGVLNVNTDQNYWLPGLTQYGGKVGYANTNLSSVVASIELLDPQAANNPSDNSAMNGEAMLDMEAVVAVTTQTRLYAMKCSETYCETNTNLIFVFGNASPRPQVISYSYGTNEVAQQSQYESSLMALTALGVTLVVAVGDCGYGSPTWPATSAYALAVGGTVMTIANGVVTSETAWSDTMTGTDCPTTAVGSQGGLSSVTPRPSYQTAANTNLSTSYRACPDVAAVAANFYCLLGSTVAGSGKDYLCGGTSLSTPLWAGVIALLNNVTLAYNGTTLGFANPLLYTMAASCSGCFYDITTGTSKGYSATAGYDLLTGLGTPNVAAMQAWLIARLATAPSSGSAPIASSSSSSSPALSSSISPSSSSSSSSSASLPSPSSSSSFSSSSLATTSSASAVASSSSSSLTDTSSAGSLTASSSGTSSGQASVTSSASSSTSSVPASSSAPASSTPASSSLASSSPAFSSSAASSSAFAFSSSSAFAFSSSGADSSSSLSAAPLPPILVSSGGSTAAPVSATSAVATVSSSTSSPVLTVNGAVITRTSGLLAAIGCASVAALLLV